MKENEALSLMCSPQEVRREKRKPGGVLQIWITNACDLCCFGCTQACNIKRPKKFMSLEHFDKACSSLREYFGIIGVFGGNPCIHPQFEEICGILSSHFPKEKCGLWANRLFGHGETCRKTFSPVYSNINVHMVKEAASEVQRDWPEANIGFGLSRDCRHSPPFVAMQDMEDLQNKEDRWELISKCDINQNWSAIICVVNNNLRGFFCEIACTIAMLHENDPKWIDYGVSVEDNWWQRPMQSPEFSLQANYYCHACGVPLRGYGELSQSTTGTEQTTKTHQSVYIPRKSGRKVEVVDHTGQLKSKGLKSTDYVGGGKK